MGANEVLIELLKNKQCYEALTTKKAFETMTQHLVSDSQDTKKYIYELLTNLI
jgi:NifU-like protein involved in Fe-S cluster formation